MPPQLCAAALVGDLSATPPPWRYFPSRTHSACWPNLLTNCPFTHDPWCLGSGPRATRDWDAAVNQRCLPVRADFPAEQRGKTLNNSPNGAGCPELCAGQGTGDPAVTTGFGT